MIMRKTQIKTLAKTSGIPMLLLAALMSCSPTQPKEARLVKPLDNSAWQKSEWISAADAPVVTGKVWDGTRAADGASWFLCTVKNSKKVLSAQWMTAGLGVYDLYVNGRRAGSEILKPGFTHYAKTKRSFTYDITPVSYTHLTLPTKA